MLGQNIQFAFFLLFRFSVYIYLCIISNYTNNLISFSLVREKNEKPNKFKLPNQDDDGIAMNTFIVCVSPLYNNFNNAAKFVEFIEFHRHIGVQKFIFYVSNVGSIVQRYLTYYKNINIADIFVWNLPTGVDAHYHAQLAALNDCLYRYRSKAKYIISLDFDEILVPVRHKHLNHLIENMSKAAYISNYVFQCVFYRTDWDDDVRYSHHLVKKLNIESLLKTKREPKPWPYNQRSKLMVIPQKIDITGIHTIWKPSDPGLKQFFVPFDIARLHHYRRFDDINNNWIVDDIMVQFQEKLIDRMIQVFNVIEHSNVSAKTTELP